MTACFLPTMASMGKHHKTFEQRFGVPRDAVVQVPEDFEPLLSTRQWRIVDYWAKHPTAPIREVAQQFGSTVNATAGMVASARRRLTQQMVRPQSHRPVLDKIMDGGNEPTPAEMQAFGRTLPPRVKSVLGLAMARPEARTVDIARELGISHTIVSTAITRIRARIKYCRARGVHRREGGVGHA
ncbi:MAG: hypothetical protein AAGL98_01180 [Planctomycetota bacterium]